LHECLQERLDALWNLWNALMDKLKDKGKKLQQAQELVQLQRDIDEAKFFIKDKVCFCGNGHGLLVLFTDYGDSVFAVCLVEVINLFLL
jgi:hypothetical protein